MKTAAIVFIAISLFVGVSLERDTARAEVVQKENAYYTCVVRTFHEIPIAYFETQHKYVKCGRNL
jgi:hypothetical protein